MWQDRSLDATLYSVSFDPCTSPTHPIHTTLRLLCTQPPSTPPTADSTGSVAPEALRRASGRKVTMDDVYRKWEDVYSFAVLMCHTLSGAYPFAGMSEKQIVAMILVDCESPSIPAHVDADPQHPVLEQMIRKLWAQNPLERDGFPAIVDQLNEHLNKSRAKRAVELAKENSRPKPVPRTMIPSMADAQRISMCRVMLRVFWSVRGILC